MSQICFGDELRRLRRQANLTLADLADTLNCSIAHISDVERGRKNPPGRVSIQKLLARMGVEYKLPEMLLLAAKARKSVEISVQDKDEEVMSLLVALARRCDEGDLDAELVKEIRRLLDKEPEK